MTAGTDPDPRARRASLAYLRQELTAPATALAEYAQALAAQVPEAAATTAGRLADRAGHLLELIHRATADDAPPAADRDHWRAVRHDLRAAAAFVISSCEDLAEASLGALDPELPQTLNAARRVLDRIDDVVRFGRDDGGALTASVRDMLARLPGAAAGPAGSAVTGRVLLVDDNEFGRDLLARMLTGQGHTVEVVPGGHEAQARLTGPGPAVDLVLLDVMMPGLTGPEVLAWLKSDARFWPLPVIMVSALGEDDSVLACIAAGAEDYLTRPVRPELLRARIAGCLEKKRLRDREAEFQARIDGLVRAIFPPAVVAEWQATGTIETRLHARVGVLFLDVVGFTEYAEKYQDDPGHVIHLLQDLVEKFETTVARHGVQKIKTIGDAFMGVVGLATPQVGDVGTPGNPAETLTRCALDLVADTAGNPAGWQVRVGIHVGPVVTGILGKTQFSFDVWGHTVNAASRVESNGRPGRVTLSAEAWEMLAGAAEGEAREVEARGLGVVTVWDFSRWVAG